MSSKFYCRSGCSGTIFPSSFNFIETWKDRDYVNPAGAAATGATWTTRCQIRHPLTIITTGIEWATSMRLGAAWRFIAGGLCMVPALRAAQWSWLLVHDVTCHYMMIHYMKLHAITCMS